MSLNGTSTPSTVPGVRDRLKAKYGDSHDPLAAIKSYDDLPAVLTALSPKPPSTRVAPLA